MDAREQRGLIIAALCKLNKTNKDSWLVPSQSGQQIYQVDPKRQTCSCLDHKEGGFKCKHLFAVEITMKRECLPDGTMIETESVTFTKKTTYKQDWKAYNSAQAVEKERFQILLKDLCRNLPDRERQGDWQGPKPHKTRDAIFAMALKVYVGLSTRRVATDLRLAQKEGFITKVIPGGKLSTFFEDEYFTPILIDLIEKSAAPLAAVESTFAFDSSGFSSNRFERWYDEKYGITRKKCVWVKAHVACGVKTNVITAVRILEKDSGDSPQFKPLLETTAKTFTVKEAVADKAYASNDNFEAVAELGGTGYMTFRSTTTGASGGLFAKMFHYFQFQQEEYLSHYHKRSNIESTFSAVKRKFGDSVRSKTDVAMRNEVLCKLLCHNLCCLIMEQETLGIAPMFWIGKDAQLEGNLLAMINKCG